MSQPITAEQTAAYYEARGLAAGEQDDVDYRSSSLCFACGLIVRRPGEPFCVECTDLCDGPS